MARSVWNGSLNIGLVSVPVRLLSAVRERSIRLHLLTPDGQCRLRQRLYCPETDREYDFSETARGYEVAPDQFVIIDEDELERIRPEGNRTIEILEFVNLGEIDPVYFRNSYYIAPQETGGRAYSLLVKALAETDRVGIGRFVMREREYVAVIRSMDDALVLHQMNYAQDIVPAQELAGEVPRDMELPEHEMAMATTLIEELTTEFTPEKYRDEYADRLEQLIEAKASGEETPAAEEEEPEPGKIINLFEALERSVSRARQGSRPEPGRRAAGDDRRGRRTA